MKTLKDYDKNFDSLNVNDKKDIKYFNILEEPFKIYGLIYENKYRRLPLEIAQKVSEGVEVLSRNTAGGRIRFKTDSSYLALRVYIPNINLMPHMALAGSLGFDVYEKENSEYVHIATMMPAWGIESISTNDKNGYYDCIYDFGTSKMRDLTLNFPLYNDVTDVFVGIQESAQLLKGDEYSNKNVVVYYGSSITQGGCASRPGNCYSHILSREFDNDFINLGFSGNAKGEDEIANYIANLNMDIFIYDYDHNAPNIKHLEDTHEKMFKIIREKKPHIPIIMISAPDYTNSPEYKKRKEVIRKTYNNALLNNDKNVYFIEGDKIFDIFGKDSCTVDKCHPNDLGFMCMAESVKRIMKDII